MSYEDKGTRFGTVLPPAPAEAPHSRIAHAICAVFATRAVVGAPAELVAHRRGF
ncbi:hypothetical protein [Saccharothrix sp. Mg75]|uniref:hypothetical protein n=1 Tax=Saccharothrix sp. Mg75 TaxID=3445357 RepID=UPI003EECCD47